MKKQFKSAAAITLAAAMTLSLVPWTEPVRTEAADLPEVTAHYDMSHSGNQLLDVSGNDRNAILYNTQDSDFKSGEGANVLQFVNRQYADLPQGLVTGTDNDFTVEITLSTETQAAQWAWCIGQGIGTWAGNDVGNYVFVNPKGAPGDRGGEILSGIKVGSPQSDEVRLPSPAKDLGSDYSTITLVGEDNTLTLYLDGEEIAETEHPYSMADIIPEGDVLGYIGKSLWEPDALLTANVGDMKFYDEALNPEQVSASMPTEGDKAAMKAAETGTPLPTDTPEPSAEPTGTPGDTTLLAAYDMSHEGDTLKDVSGNGNDAVLYGTEEEDFYSSGETDVWKLSNDGYAELPSSISEDLGDSEDFTVQATLTTQTSAAHWLFTIGDGVGTWNAKNVGNYIFVNPSASEKGGNFLAAIKTGTGNEWKESRFNDSSTGMGDVNGYGTVTLTGQGGNLKLYLDGELVSSASQDKTIQDVLPDNIFGYIGKSLYEPDALLTANLADFRIYSGAMSQEEIQAGLPGAEEKNTLFLADVLETVKGANESLEAVKENLSLPEKIDNVEISWGQWDQSVIAADGTVTAPTDQETVVSIPFTYELGGSTYEETIEATVPPVNAEEEVKEALASIDIPNKDDVRGNITLPETSENGLAITWTTDHSEIVNVEAVENEGYDPTPAGTVTRPEKDTVVTMTASVTMEDVTETKEIPITVKAAPAEISDSDYTDYFFAYFAGEGYSDGEQIYFASSQDGLNWDDLNNNEPVLTSTLGEKGVRDPFIIRSPEGDKFYLIATDLKINGGNGWDAAQNNGSQSLMVWESNDLIHWSDQRMVEVSAEIGAGCTWAPEATYDPMTGEYVVYWASRTPAVDSKQRVYYAKTRDFYTFTEPEVFIDYDESSIDTTIIKGDDGYYYRYTKNEGGATNDLGALTKTVFVERSQTLLGEWEHIPSDSLNANQWVEGPTIFKLNEDDATDTQKYCLLVDNYGGGGYYPLTTDDLSDGVFSRPDTAYKMPSRARHGTPIRVTAEEYQAIMAAYSAPEEVNAATEAGTAPELPDTVTVDLGDEKVEKAVTWNLEGVSFDGEPFSTVTVKGTVEGSSYEATANVRILPQNLEYMIDCNNPESATWAAAMELTGGLLNGEAADQAKTDSNTWGYTSTVGSSDPADITGYSQNDINNPYAGGWWARGGKNVAYEITLPAGEHTIMLGCNGWWNRGRQMDIFYSVNGGAEEKLCDLDAVANTGVYASGTITLEEEAVVTLTVKKADGNDPILSWIAVSGTPEEPVVSTPLLAEFTFNSEASDGVFTGSSRTDAVANVNGSVSIQDKLGSDKALYLDGTADNYLSLTKKDGSSLLTGKEEITISFDTKRARTATNWIFYAAPDDSTQTYNSEHYFACYSSGDPGIRVERYNNSGSRSEAILGTAGANWVHVDVVVSADATSLYINGELADTVDSEYSIGEILGDSSIFYLGKANWGSGEYANCWIDNFRIYDGMLSKDDITAQYSVFAEQMFWDGVSLPTEPIKGDLDLPETNTAGDTVTWTSGNPDILADDGTLVSQPAEDTEVVMTAEISGQKKEFTVTVAGLSSLLQEAADALTIENADDVRGNLALVKEGENGTTINWTSGNTDVVTDEPMNEDSLYDGGEVTRPAAGEEAVKVTLTAEISLKGQTTEKTFEVTVQPMPEDLDTDYTAGYLWTNFDASGGYEKIFFGYSEDGLTWSKLNKDAYGNAQPVLVNDAEGSDLGVRDPHIIRSAEGDRYWILGTDLHAEGGGAGGSGWDQQNASQNIVVWESNDLVNWSEPKLVYSGFENAGCVWAPEAIYDETTGDYLVYWSARDKSQNGTDDNALRVYVCRTRDFNTFSEPKVWLSEDQENGAETNIIDSTIVQGDDGRYYRFSTSDWNTVLDVSDTLDADDVFDVSVNADKSTPDGSWTRLIKRGEHGSAGFTSVEGLTAYQLPDGRWCVMGDNQGYQAFVTDDLASAEFEPTQVSFVDGRFRHGTVMRLSEAEQARLLEAYGEQSQEPENPETEAEEPVLEYTFEEVADNVIKDTATGNDTADDGTIFGSAKVVYDEEKGSNVLQLDGSSGGYAQLPTGFFDGRDTMSISMDVKSNLGSGNFFTFTYGKDSTSYDFLRVRGTEVRNAITTAGWQNEREVKGTGAVTGTWQKIDLVIDGVTMKLYIDGLLVSENDNTGITTSNFGAGVISYLGKSFYDDPYFNGSFDNVRVYNRALTEEEIVEAALADENVALLKNAVIGTVPEDPAGTMGTDYHTAVTTKLDAEKKEITSYIRKNADLTAVPVEFSALGSTTEIKVNGEVFENGSTLDLSQDAEVTLTFGDRTETWTLKTPAIAYNPVLPGQYSDPDIDFLDGKYWMYTTTDGYSGWSGTVFHAWSSEDMRNWTDEGIILDLANDNPGLNDQGVQIEASDWAVGSAWAPSIEEKNGKYYFYYCGKFSNGESAIGVAVADNPAGPYTDKGEALMTVSMCRNAGVNMGQAIDPSIFTDDDGTSYLLFGNGSAAIAELNDDMMSIKEGTIRQINGVNDFRESVVVTKRDGLYHFTWSCDDTGSPNYHVNYGTAETLEGGSVNVTYRYTLLQKDEANSMLGTAHQSILYFPETDECYIAYHRFYTPIGVYTDGLGYHRETCIDQVTFGEDGLMQPLAPTMEGVYRPVNEEPEPEVTLTSLTVTPPTKLEYTAGEELDTTGMTATAVYSDGSTKDVTAEADISGYNKDAEGTQEITVTYTEGEQTATATFNVTVKAAEPTQEPTPEPSEEPTPEPTQEPTGTPTQEPTGEPTGTPTQKPTGTQKPSGTPGTSVTPGGTQSGGQSAQTGDTTNFAAPIAAIAVAAVVLIIAVVVIRKRRNS